MTTLFIVSLFAICALIGSKILEERVQKFSFWTNLSVKGDAKIHYYIERLIVQYNLARKIAYLFVFDFLPSYAYELLVRTKDYVAKKYYAAGNDFRGRRVLRSNGTVSFFLKRITEEESAVESRKA